MGGVLIVVGVILVFVGLVDNSKDGCSLIFIGAIVLFFGLAINPSTSDNSILSKDQLNQLLALDPHATPVGSYLGNNGVWVLSSDNRVEYLACGQGDKAKSCVLLLPIGQSSPTPTPTLSATALATSSQ